MKNLPLMPESDSLMCYGGRRFCILLWFAILSLLFIPLSPPASGAEAPKAKNVLVMYSFSDPTEYDPIESLESAIRAKAASPINFYVENMESQRLVDEAYRKSWAETLARTYHGVSLDLVIAFSYPALQFAVQYRDEIFPGRPIVFSDVHVSRFAGRTMWPGVTGVTVPVDVAGTLALALRLHPDTDTIAVIAGTSELESYWAREVHTELLRHRDRVTEVDFVGPPSAQLLENVAALPPHTVVLFQMAPQYSSQLAIGYNDILAIVSQRLPTYSIFPAICLDRGCIGGVRANEKEQTASAAAITGRLFAGERPESIPVMHGSSTHIEVDWRQLRRWHIPDSALPPGTVILYRQPTLWERDRRYILAAIALIVAQALLIIGLLWQRARKRAAEAVLRESEKRFRVMADTTPSLVWMCDSHGKITYLNERRTSFTGTAPNAEYNDTWVAYVHTDDLENVLNTLAEALYTRQPFSMEYRLRRRDGVYRWMFDVASPRVNGDGSFAGFIASAVDTTDQKIAQQALEKISGQLIEAQEKERTRIARELHDDICQRLALLSVEIEQAHRSQNGSPAVETKSLQEIQRHCAEIATDVQSMSHQLHSSKLDLLGIKAALRGFCKEFSNQYEVNVEFTERNVPTQVSKEISLCLFRVAQEALHNAVKYSGVRQFAVELSGRGNEVQLVVNDCGAGFDIEKTRTNRGLGLLSMQERIYLVHGKFAVNSKPGQGTTIIATVPLAPENRRDMEPMQTHIPAEMRPG
jgi:PAS domain S-box-containing protein